MMPERRRIVLVTLALLLGSLAGLVVVAVAIDRDTAVDVATILAIPPAVAALWIAWKALQTGSGSSAPALSTIARELAATVRDQWQLDMEARRIYDPYPLPVRWVTAHPSLVDHWVNVRDDGIDAPLALDGRFQSIAVTYQRVPSKRLVLLGGSGAGKTILVASLALTLLADPDVGSDTLRPVPVLLSPTSWEPNRESFQAWLERELIRLYPALSVKPTGKSTLAAQLARGGLVLPILDGFDELAEGLRALALHVLGDSAGGLLLTSRTEEYRAAGTENGRPLARAGAIEMQDLSRDDLDAYLSRTTGAAAGDSSIWADVLNRPPVRAALATPLMVSLARANYSDTGTDPAELLPYRTKDGIEEHLLESFLPARYDNVSDRRTGRWDSSEARHYLFFLAIHMKRFNTDSIEWWHLSRSVPKAVPVALGLLGGVLLGLGFWLALEAMGGNRRFGLTYGMTGGCVHGLQYGLACAFGRSLPPSRATLRLRRHRKGARFGWRLAGYGFLYGMLSQLANGLAASSALFVTTGVFTLSPIGLAMVWGLVVGMLFAVVAGARSPIDLTSVESPESLLRRDRAATIVTSLLGSVSLSFALMAWGRLQLARVWFATTGRLPWRIMLFLRDAQRRDVLRQVGTRYQFRHDRFREHLLRSAHVRP
ncbi:NACHT domain-containing NTPase [Nonomuraea sp. MTCD27]|uniref:NACHT domain-containing protein n=1 Tax=Nonomuraea sp. MTCD27 TaxID=1676747 RepID=UPI0035BF9CAE